ncbi:MAG TPA: TorF family putative porin, partial [Steroidobacteraceae bacterium]|nr:TorF family putative porin [Steroidobacteraceae bacterium]
MSHPYSSNLGRARPLLAWALLSVGAAPAGAGMLGEQLSFGGNLSFTTDYIYHGVSESNDHGALQGDLHLATTDGSFAGVWGSTRDSQLDPGGSYDFELYLG